MCSTTVPSQNGGPCSASAAPLITPMISSTDVAGGVGELVVPVLAQMTAQRRVSSASCMLNVMVLGDTVFAVVAAELGQEGDRLLGSLGDEFVRTARPAPGRKP